MNIKIKKLFSTLTSLLDQVVFESDIIILYYLNEKDIKNFVHSKYLTFILVINFIINNSIAVSIDDTSIVYDFKTGHNSRSTSF